MQEILQTIHRVLKKDQHESLVVPRIADDGSYWFKFYSHDAYLGETEESALLTARRGDWFVPFRDGRLTIEVRAYFVARRDEDPLTDDDRTRVELNQLEPKFQDELVEEGVREMAFDREMDAGEPLDVNDLVSFCEPTPSLEADIINLYSVHSPKPLAKTRGVLKGFPAEKLYQYKNGYLVQSTLSVHSDGWRLTEDGVLGQPPQTNLIMRAQVVIDPNTQHILNLQVFDKNGNIILHLIGDENGGLVFDRFSLETIE